MNNFLQERVTKGERVVKETHDENKRNVNHDSIDSNVGSKTHHIPKIDMRKFDGKDPATWILQMEQFFDLNNVQNTQKVRIATLYLEPKSVCRYQWLCSRQQFITWAIFTEELIAHYEDTKSNTFFYKIDKSQQKGSIMEHIEEFQKFNIRVNDIPEEHKIDVFIESLKDNIQHDVRLWEPDSLEKAFTLARKMESKIMATRKHTTHIYKDRSVAATSLPQPIRLTPQQLEEKRAKGLCYSSDRKYTKGHKCAKKKLFYIDCEEEEEKEQERSKEEDILEEQSLDEEQMNPTISCNALAGITTPQTIKIEGQIKKKKVIVLIDSGSTHNFIHCKVAKELNCFLYLAPECQVMIANGGTINCSQKCHNIKLSMGQYILTSPMLSIPMGGANVVLGVQWLQSLGTIAFNFQEHFMKFYVEGKEIELRGITRKLGKIISSNGMTKLLKKERKGVIAQLCSLAISTLESSISRDLQIVLDNHSKVFETPKGIPPIRDHDHAIHLIPGSVPPNIRPYGYPYAQKSEIERMVAEMLEAGIIQPSQSSFSAAVVLVHKKDGSWCMCLYYRELNKLTIKDNFPIPVIDELLDELHGSIYFTKLDLRSRYHQIRMKTEDILETTFRTHEGHYEFLVMPFGLTNAPSTFQASLGRIMLNMLTWCYNYWRRNNYMRKDPSFFGVQEVEYLAHILSHEGVKVDPIRIKAIKEWKIPTSIKHIRGFLRLIGYYCKFVKNYGKIETPLTTLLKIDEFSWTPEATKAFEHVKEEMCQAPVLATTDFTKTFIVECDASGNGTGTILIQDERPITFESRPIKGKVLHKAIYEKEMLAILHALKKW
eukprot:PITA_20057